MGASYQMRIGGETFHATGLCIQDLGYLRVYPYDRWSDKTLPTYIEGEQLLDFELRIANGQTQPPELLNEVDMVECVEGNLRKRLHKYLTNYG
ncbi:hypothetical protein NECAME_03880 [Necator americanus]|uniref:DNA topoisomerase n=1 Tax=Necator americanus TaxID=51031 RepID=W2SZ31_NECAM|nr:hypothetical protein NECAME_03880 [Necator americanus]ETN74965.1 hypothetical protein NECAME_03880 [Necator americanus]